MIASLYLKFPSGFPAVSFDYNYVLLILSVLILMQAPRTSRASLVKGSRSQANAVAQQALIAHWQSIVKSLNNYLKTLRANYVSPAV